MRSKTIQIFGFHLALNPSPDEWPVPGIHLHLAEPGKKIILMTGGGDESHIRWGGGYPVHRYSEHLRSLAYKLSQISWLLGDCTCIRDEPWYERNFEFVTEFHALQYKARILCFQWYFWTQ